MVFIQIQVKLPLDMKAIGVAGGMASPLWFKWCQWSLNTTMQHVKVIKVNPSKIQNMVEIYSHLSGLTYL